MAFIDARGGKIIFGENCIIEEKARIVNKVRAKDQAGQPIPKEMHIGSYNLFEAGSTISTSEIGDCNEFSNKCFVEDNSKIGNCCTIGPKVTLPVGSRLGDNIIVYEDSKQMVNDDQGQAELRK